MNLEEIEHKLRHVVQNFGVSVRNDGLDCVLDGIREIARTHGDVHELACAVWNELFTAVSLDLTKSAPFPEGKPMVWTFCPGATLDVKIDGNLTKDSKPLYVQASGRGISAARTIRTLGITSPFEPTFAQVVGWIGGNTGHILKKLLHTDGVPADFLSIPGETRVCLYGASGRILYDPGPSVCDEEISETIQASIHRLSHADFVVLAGSIPPRLNPDFYSRIVKALKANRPDCQIIVDTYAHLLKPILHDVESKICLATPNLEEFSGLVGIPPVYFRRRIDRVIHHAKPLLSKHFETLIVTLAEEGAVLLTERGDKTEIYTASPPQTMLVDSQGAGDTFLGAYLYAWIHLGWPPADALRFAVSAGTISVGRMGTGGIESYGEVTHFMHAVEICKVA